MRRTRPRLARTVGLVALVALLTLNGWLAMLNLAKHDRLPFDAAVVPGVAEVASARAATAGDVDGGGAGTVGGGPATLLTAEGPFPTANGVGRSGDGDGWPGGRGPLPVGPPEVREVLVAADGGLRVVGSAPTWSVVAGLVDVLGRRSELGPLAVDVANVTWHPEASARLDDGLVRLERPLLYDAGEVGLPVDGPEILTPAADLLLVRPQLYAVLVAHVDDLGDSAAPAAVALARARAATDELVKQGVERTRVVAVVAPASPDAPVATDDDTRRHGRRVEVRIENLLVPSPTA